jgi:stage V sporulation protein R
LLDPSEILDFADCHSSATMSVEGNLNPYKLGIELYRHAEARGEDIFQLRRVHNDVSLIHKLVDEDFTMRHIRPILPDQSADPKPGEFDWRAAKSWLLHQLAWGGLPQIQLVGVDLEGEGELALIHHHDGRDLQLGRAQETLRNLSALWQRPVHLLTLLEKQGKKVIVSGGEMTVVDTSEAEEHCGDGRPQAESA